MLSMNIVDSYLSRIGITDITFSVVGSDATGDLLTLIDPDFSFNTVKDAISKSFLNSRIIDNGREFIELEDNMYINGDKVVVDILINKYYSNGTGVQIKLMVKRLYHVIDGEMKEFLGFGDLKQYKERFVVERGV